MNKKYNPFKMWGSWIGALILPFWFIANMITQKCVGIIVWGVSCTRDWSLFFSNEWLQLFSTNSGTNSGTFELTMFWIIIFIIALIGFLLGWIINSLWRKYK